MTRHQRYIYLTCIGLCCVALAIAIYLLVYQIGVGLGLASTEGLV